MSQGDLSVSLYLDNVPDIQKAIEVGKRACYDRVVSRISNAHLNQRSDCIGSSNKVFTRSDLLLKGSGWRHDTILKVGEFGDCDSSNLQVQKQSERILKQEIDWAKHVDSFAHLIVRLNNDKSINLARQLLVGFEFDGSVLIETPIVDTTYYQQKYSNTTNQRIELSAACAMVWHRWNKFRLALESNDHFKVALELDTTELPSEVDICRWYGEPVDMIIIPSFCFEQTNNNNQIYLNERVWNICVSFLQKTKAKLAVRSSHDDPWLEYYPKCLRAAFATLNRSHGVKHECNTLNEYGLKLPITPADTINTCTKYLQRMYTVYASAIKLAIEDRFQSTDKVSILICGTNGWKMLEPVMTIISDSSAMNSAVEVYILEEDASTRISIVEAIAHLYADRSKAFTHIVVTVLIDAQIEQFYQMMDIVVSVTNEAIYEGQWLQFNFDTVRNYIHPEAILIPHQSSLSIVPITSAKAYSYLTKGHVQGYHPRDPALRFEHYWTRAQTTAPMYSRNVYECAARQELFSFRYSRTYDDKSIQISTETRLKRFEFKIERDCIVTAFGGYSVLHLYKDITLSNQALLNSQNENCVPMAYFPLKSAQTLSAQDKFCVTFWMHSNAARHQFWYEWKTTAPHISINHNLKGEAYTLSLPSQV